MQQPIKYFHKRLNSTNLYALQILANRSAMEPFWVRTDDQFAGRGQGKNTWTSEPGQNLTGTLTIFPAMFEASQQFVLSKTFALSAAAFLELFVDDVSIKWPNDLYSGDRKIGGILIETAIMGKFVNYAIHGIGLNVNQINFPESLPNPVSIGLLTGVKYSLTEMEDLFLLAFISYYSLIESGSFDEINRQYINKLFRYNQPAMFKEGENTFIASIKGVTEYGHLILQTNSGTTKTFAHQQVEYII